MIAVAMNIALSAYGIAKAKLIKNCPNVIFVLVETSRADHYGCFGYHRDNTTNIDRLAKDSVLFKKAITQAPCTIPAVWNVLSSKYQSSVPSLSSYVTMAEYFKSKGYTTAAITSHQFLRDLAQQNLQQGFDHYDTFCELNRYKGSARRAEYLVDAARKWIKKNNSRPFFLWLFFFDPHDPYVPPDEFIGYYNKTSKYSGDRRAKSITRDKKIIPEEHRRFLINAYDEEIRYFDHQLGIFLDSMKKNGGYDNSLIILTSDHGEELGDNGGRWDHAQLVSQEEIHVPLLIKLPGTHKKTVVGDEWVQTIDIFPTIIEYFDEGRMPSFFPTLEGQSLLPLIRGTRGPDFRSAFSFWREQKCVLKAAHKYWYDNGKESYVDLKSRSDIDDENVKRELKTDMKEICDKYLNTEGYYDRNSEMLKSLGYL